MKVLWRNRPQCTEQGNGATTASTVKERMQRSSFHEAAESKSWVNFAHIAGQSPSFYRLKESDIKTKGHNKPLIGQTIFSGMKEQMKRKIMCEKQVSEPKNTMETDTPKMVHEG